MKNVIIKYQITDELFRHPEASLYLSFNIQIQSKKIRIILSFEQKTMHNFIKTISIYYKILKYSKYHKKIRLHEFNVKYK